jgi:hypothetical protein
LPGSGRLYGVVSAPEFKPEEHEVMLTTRSRTNRYLLAAVVLVCLVPCSFAAQLVLVDPGTNAPYDGVLVGPYEISVDGVSIQAICLDYQYTTKTNDPWSADVSGVGSDTILQEQAYLASMLLAITPGTNNTLAAELQYAIWDLSPVNSNLPPTVADDLLTISGLDSAGSDFVAAVEQYESDAVAFVTGNPNHDYSNVSVYNPTAPPQPDILAMQRFITVTSVPEPPVLSVLGLDLSAVGAMIFLLRKRIVSA